MNPMKWLFLLGIGSTAALGDVDFWELEPIRYSDAKPTDALASVAADFASGKRNMEGGTALERLRFVLKTLEIPEESQVLVFSKTSHQNSLIHPGNPRALYFSANAYVGYVPGGKIEAIVRDSILGVVFYLIDDSPTGGLKIERDFSNCLSCHGTTATEHVPGLQVRSVLADAGGHPLLALGTSQVSHETPVAERWGSYYVTGRGSLPHLGNRIYQENGPVEPRAEELIDLHQRIDVSKYPCPTSDVVALMVLEHQCKIHNLMTAASMQYRRAYFLGHAMDANRDPDLGSAGQVADASADKIVECLFFKDEADLGENLEGDEAFQRSFGDRIPKTSDGRSLADFQLFHRLFKHRCSYMIYSQAFADLPLRVKRSVLEKMHSALEDDGSKVDWLKASERKKISEVLAETLPGW
jgi:hypothetical protein